MVDLGLRDSYINEFQNFQFFSHKMRLERITSNQLGDEHHFYSSFQEYPTWVHSLHMLNCSGPYRLTTGTGSWFSVSWGRWKPLIEKWPIRCPPTKSALGESGPLVLQDPAHRA